MKTEFKAKFLQHVAKKRKEEGFTLIELLVVIIIIGILSAIALPSFLNQANKAKQSEAKQYLASINKGQQAYYAEEGDFINDIEKIGNLGLGIKTATGNYTYTLGEAEVDGKNGANAWTKNAVSGLNYYVGAVYLTAAGNALTSQTILCESDEPSTDAEAAAPEPPGNAQCEDITGYTTAL
ncbi:type IV pilin-like G/H family protein [Okeania sp. SIO1F9]|uniref:type IV pilin-like G/H family protein n=1 Tax=Okeania sp. SIO1F9 TaxID=2607813 RepID=UPI00144DDB39|nr:type IV pilin-like G/H family protein [Okeania sp. SIO1F9]NET77917.1 prepilin-type N-terminal cleavage/methylation domain-containing protein [Okeania sp. SIO1F9]